VAVGIVLAALGGAGDASLLVLALGVLGVASLGAALWRERVGVVPWSLLLLGAAASVAFANDANPGRAPLYAAALVAVAELAYWSLEERGSRPATPGLAVRRTGRVAGMVAGTLVVGALLVSVAAIEPGGGLVLETLGVAAAVAAAALVLTLSRRAA
jgi:hypothetical protein